MTFIHLHTHTEYSWLDGACTIDELVERAAQLRMPAVAITDRNSVAGANRLWQKCLKHNLKPIIGLEIEVLNDTTDGRAFSVILLAKNGNGYANLCTLVSLAHQNNPLAPQITKSDLQLHSGDLICLSFSVVGELCTLLLEGRDAEALQVSDWYYSVFGDDYYYEIQNHGLPREAIAMNKLLNLGFHTKIPVVLTNDCHYLERKDSPAIDALNCIRKRIDFSHPEAKRFACNEYYFKTPQEMKSLAPFPDQLIQNTLAIADKIYCMDGYIPFAESVYLTNMVMDSLREFSPALKIKLNSADQHITISLNGMQSEAILEHLGCQLPEFDIMPFTKYTRWNPQSIYSAVLNAMKVKDEKQLELCDLVPPKAKTLKEATLLSTDFSCLCSEDFVCDMAANIADKLISTFQSEETAKHCYAVIPKDITVPIVMNKSGEIRCQYGQDDIADDGFVCLEFMD